jgi:GDP/UDP-N,N'-diacetylbacillosamine 2-epimerase (hydrolysing)
VIGNSSSGIIEVPSLHVPTVNIGDRQKGRLMADSVINCKPTTKDIADALHYALSEEGKNKAASIHNPYDGDDVSSKIVYVLNKFLSSAAVDLKKSFFDLQRNT